MRSHSSLATSSRWEGGSGSPETASGASVGIRSDRTPARTLSAVGAGFRPRSDMGSDLDQVGGVELSEMAVDSVPRDVEVCPVNLYAEEAPAGPGRGDRRGPGAEERVEDK